MDKIECLVCNNILELPHYIDTDGYEGHVVCKKCKALLYIKLVLGKAKK